MGKQTRDDRYVFGSDSGVRGVRLFQQCGVFSDIVSGNAIGDADLAGTVYFTVRSTVRVCLVVSGQTFGGSRSIGIGRSGAWFP